MEKSLSFQCKPGRPGAVRVLSGAAFVVCSLLATVVLASQGGRSGFSGDPSTNAGATCEVCHAPGGAGPAEVGIVGPATVEAGTTRNFFVVVAEGPGHSAGVGISSEGGIGDLLPADGDLRQLDSELVHAGPKPFGDGFAAFVFRYVAPNYDTEVTLHAAGNSTDGGLDLQGDAIATASMNITVTNGFESPPDPPEPPEGELTPRLFASGLSGPVAIENMGDTRLFVVERGGRIRIIERNGTVVSTPFLDISTRVDDTATEQGLLGLAFHPDYRNNGYFYVYYTRDPGPGRDRSRISRFSVSADPNVANAASELVLLEFEQPRSNHNGGDIHFGPAGYLHIASGDGGGGGDPDDYGQDTGSLLGKMLRIDVDTPPGAGTGADCGLATSGNYSIPPGNAFVDGQGGNGCDEIFAMGVRNPWRFAFDRETGAMWIADVGQNAYEEINYLPPGNSGGLNLGWRCYEGDQPYNLAGCNLAYLPPVHTYSQATSGCSVTGGRVYRGVLTPELQGQYFFSDFCQSSIRALSGNPGSLSYRVVVPTGTLSAVSTFGEDFIGEIYVAELYTGDIYRLDGGPPPGC